MIPYIEEICEAIYTNSLVFELSVLYVDFEEKQGLYSHGAIFEAVCHLQRIWGGAVHEILQHIPKYSKIKFS